MLASSTSSILFLHICRFFELHKVQNVWHKAYFLSATAALLTAAVLLATIPFSPVSMNSSVTQAVVRITGSWTKTQIFPECGSVCQNASSIHAMMCWIWILFRSADAEIQASEVTISITLWTFLGVRLSLMGFLQLWGYSAATWWKLILTWSM